MLEVKIPDIGDFKDVPVIEVFVKVGDRVAVDDPLFTLETEKAAMEVPSPAAGVVQEIKLKVGDKVSEGSLVLLLDIRDQELVAAPAPPAPAAILQPAAQASAPPPPATPAAPVQVAAEHSGGAKPHASPSVRRFARELGVDVAKVPATGPKGRVLHEDVKAYVKNALAQPAATTQTGGAVGGLALAPWPKVDFAKFGPVDVQPLSRIKKLSGANLARNWVMIPHVTQFDDADITDLEALRVQLNREYEKSSLKLTMLAFLIKVSVAALKKFPDFNASLDGENLVHKQYFHIGFAADTPNGLMVPVIRDVDKKGVIEIAQETAVLAGKAREGKLTLAEMQGGCFSISSLGGIGGTAFTPIINAPEVAILGVSKSITKPVWDDKVFAPRLMLPLSLSYDHRVIDGAQAARFTTYLTQLLADMRRVLL